MRRGGGKAKGSSFERETAKSLSLWLTRGESSTQLIRSVMSGGWSRGTSKKTAKDEGYRQVGDLAPNGTEGERFRALYAVECKHRKDISLDYLWSRPNERDGLKAWWEKLVKDCKAAGVQPLLIFRCNKMPIMAAMQPDYLLKMIKHSAQVEWLNMVVFPFEELLELRPSLFMEPSEAELKRQELDRWG